VRTLLLLILLLIIYWWARRVLTRGAERNKQRKRSAQQKVSETEEKSERVIACRHCGVHIPESEGVREGKDFFCSEAHRRLGVKR